ncbi:MAG TPA: hypothetical protein VLL50_14365, partial [Usitatibacter sp.]|nr:hypothetical protein [Usitatibacter sp.]
MATFGGSVGVTVAVFGGSTFAGSDWAPAFAGVTGGGAGTGAGTGAGATFGASATFVSAGLVAALP